MRDKILIGGASGFWGDAALATPQLLATGQLDYLVYDYLAEITMSIMARARAQNPEMGYAVDFVSVVLKPNLAEIARQNVKVIANAGGVNPKACADAVRELLAEQNLDLTVAVIIGDDLMERRDEFAAAAVSEMFTGEDFPDPQAVASINAYLGAFPIARALDEGADIIVTGRCVDSAVTLGACIHAFSWLPENSDQLAQASLAGHLLECGTQATGGNFTDWEAVVDTLPEAGYPIAEVSASGDFVITKPEGSGGLVSVGTIAEQMLYEIGDPQAYMLPDVVCDFSAVELREEAANRVAVSGARGAPAPASYKVSATWADGFRAGQIWTMYGRDADIKAQKFADAVFQRARTILQQQGLADFTETSCEIVGAESHYGEARQVGRVREVDIKIAARHPSPRGIGILLKEMIGMALTAPPGLTAFAGARPKPSPVVRLFSMLVPREQVSISLEIDGVSSTVDVRNGTAFDPAAIARPALPDVTGIDDPVHVSLESLAWGRSGDKGNKANIGIIARDPEFLPYIATQLTEQRVAQRFSHFLEPGQEQPVQRFYLPGSNALNFLLDKVLGGGGVASLRVDSQGKGYAQLLLAEAVAVPHSLARRCGLEIIQDKV